MKIVYRAGDITEAEIVKGMLISNNIEAHVSGYYLQGGIGETAPLDLAKVHVPDEDYDKARELVSEYEGAESEQSGTLNDLRSIQSSRLQKNRNYRSSCYRYFHSKLLGRSMITESHNKTLQSDAAKPHR